TPAPPHPATSPRYTSASHQVSPALGPAALSTSARPPRRQQSRQKGASSQWSCIGRAPQAFQYFEMRIAWVGSLLHCPLPGGLGGDRYGRLIRQSAKFLDVDRGCRDSAPMWETLTVSLMLKT